MSPFLWSPGTVEQLLILRAQGLKLSRIAADLGTTRSAIEHKLRRLPSQKPAQAPAAVRRPLKLLDLRPPPLPLDCIWERRRGAVLRKAKSGHLTLLF